MKRFRKLVESFVALVALRGNLAIGESGPDGTIRFSQMAAVIETAVWAPGDNLAKTPLHASRGFDIRCVVSDSWRVNEFATARQSIECGCGGGMPTLTRFVR